MFCAEAGQGRGYAVLAAAVALLIFAVASPTTAGAATFTVNSTGDEADLAAGGGCLTAAGKCTLRAAIEEANAGSGGDDL